MQAAEAMLDDDAIDQYTSELRDACDANDCDQIQQILQLAVAEFNAKDGISDAIWQRRLDNGLVIATNDKVVNIISPKTIWIIVGLPVFAALIRVDE